jgi:VWFA-related protein
MAAGDWLAACIRLAPMWMIFFLFAGLLCGQAESPKFAVRSNLVSLPTRVQSRSGETVYGLRADQFVVEDNGLRQVVKVDEDPESLGLSLVVLVQCSRSAPTEFRKIKGLGAMVDGILGGAAHEVAIVGFGQAQHVLQDFSAAEDAVALGMSRLKACGEYAASIDAVYSAINMLKKRKNNYRHAILLISETRDHGSRAKLDEVVGELGVTDTAIYTVAFSPTKDEVLDGMRYGDHPPAAPAFQAPAGSKAGGEPAAPVMTERPPLFAWPPQLLLIVNALRQNSAAELASLSGGEMFSFSSQAAFEKALQRISNEIHNYYLLSFAPKGGTQLSLHTLRVRVPDYPDAVVQTRRSYWAGL